VEKTRDRDKKHVVLSGKFLRTLRIIAKMNSEEAAHRLHIDVRSLSRYENEKAPTPEDIQCKMLNIYLPEGGEQPNE